MPTLYQHLKQQCNLYNLEYLHTVGLLKQNVLRNLKLYEFYIAEINKGMPRMQARTNTAEEFFTSEDNVSKIIAQYSCDAKVFD